MAVRFDARETLLVVAEVLDNLRLRFSFMNNHYYRCYDIIVFYLGVFHHFRGSWEMI